MNTVTSRRLCPVCQSDKVRPIHTMSFSLPADSPLPKEYVITTCTCCGMVYADSNACQEDYDRYYAQFSKYEDEKIASGGGHNETDRQRLNIVASLLIRHTNTDARLLDIGCANGGMLEACAAKGFTDLTGVDPSATSIRLVQERGFNGKVMNIGQLSPEAIGTFDIIILSHVLEHVYDIKKTLSILHSLLSDKGLLYIEVPDADEYPFRTTVPYYYFDPEHINHFNCNMLEKMAILNGYTVRDTGKKLLPVTESFSYPAVYVLLEKTALNHATEISLQFISSADESLSDSVQCYIEQCNTNNLQKKVSMYAKSGDAVIIWGAGSYTQRLLGSTDLMRCNIVAIIDNDRNKHGRLIAGVRITPPESARNISGTILIAAALHADAIKAEICSMKLPHSVDVLC